VDWGMLSPWSITGSKSIEILGNNDFKQEAFGLI
jgi:hypothetical protein